MKTKDVKGIYNLAMTLFVLSAIVITLWLTGITTQKMWLWFLVPTIGVIPLTWSQALGISFTVAWLTHPTHEETPEDLEKYIKHILVMVFRPIMTLFLGWILYTLM